MLSPEQIQQYQDDGYTCVHDLFDPAQIDALEEAFDGIIDRRLANRAKMDATWGGEKWRQKYDNGGGRTTILVTHDVQAYDAAWSRALLHPPLTEALSDCMGSPNVQLHHTKLFQKPPEKGSAFPMHQDYPYFPHENHSMMAAVIYLSDATDEMGCFRVYPGSHKNGPMTPDEGNHLDPDQWPIEKATPLPVRRGDVLLFNYLLIHGSAVNRSPHVRKSVLVQVRDPEDPPTRDTHLSHAQGMMLRGINPLSRGQAAASGTLNSGTPVAPPKV